MVRVPDSSVVDRRIELRSGQPKHYEIGIRDCCSVITMLKNQTMAV
jgi:hypothetical protein